MGGNVKDAFTEEPTVTRECGSCGAEFEDTVKYSPKQYCECCRDGWNDPEELTADLAVDVDADTREVGVTVSVMAPDVPDSVSVMLPCETVDSETIVGTLRVTGGGEVWYEDAWVEQSRHVSREALKVRGGRTWTTPWGGEEETAPRKYSGRDGWESARAEYRAHMGDPFDAADELEAEFSFVCDALGTVTATASLPDYLIDI